MAENKSLKSQFAATAVNMADNWWRILFVFGRGLLRFPYKGSIFKKY